MTLGQKIKFECKQQKISIAELARRTGISYSTVKDLINDNYKASFNNVVTIANELDLDLNLLADKNWVKSCKIATR